MIPQEIRDRDNLVEFGKREKLEVCVCVCGMPLSNVMGVDNALVGLTDWFFFFDA